VLVADQSCSSGWLSVPQCASPAGVSRQAVHAWVRWGVGGRRLDALWIGSRLAVRRSSLVRFLKLIGRGDVVL
jgi:hypothetical protein